MSSSKASALLFERAIQRWFCAAGLACLSLGCSGDAELEQPEPSSNTWVGEVRDTDVKVALASRGGKIVLFFCGGDDSYTSNTRWFDDDTLFATPFSFSGGGWSVAGATEGHTVSGSIETEADGARDWTADPADPGTLAGLYEGVAPCGRLGLIVTQPTVDDEPTGQGACLRVTNDGVIVEQVNPVRLELSSKHELLVTVTSVPDERFTVRPVAGARP